MLHIIAHWNVDVEVCTVHINILSWSYAIFTFL